MKSLSPALRTHLLGPVTTLCWCWKVTRADGVVLGFTDHDRPLEVDGTSYEADSGFSASEISSSLGLAVDNLDVEGALSSDAIAEADIAAGRYDGADVELWRVNWADTDQRVLISRGSIGEIGRGELAFTAELRGLAHLLDQTNGHTYQRICDAVVGDARCGVDLDDPAHRGEAAVASVDEDSVIATADLAGFVDGWFSGGRLTWITGANAGTSADIRSHAVTATGARIALWRRAPLPVQPGDQFVVTAGCDKTFETCRAKFDNGVNFRGFPHMPGNDRAFSYVVGESGENDGGSFFN